MRTEGLGGCYINININMDHGAVQQARFSSDYGAVRRGHLELDRTVNHRRLCYWGPLVAPAEGLGGGL